MTQSRAIEYSIARLFRFVKPRRQHDFDAIFREFVTAWEGERVQQPHTIRNAAYVTTIFENPSAQIEPEFAVSH